MVLSPACLRCASDAERFRSRPLDLQGGEGASAAQLPVPAEPSLVGKIHRILFSPLAGLDGKSYRMGAKALPSLNLLYVAMGRNYL